MNKPTVEEVFSRIDKVIAMYQPLLDAAELVQEMEGFNSIWDIYSLIKMHNDDYEHITELNDNIETLAEARTLKSFISDIEEVKKEILLTLKYEENK